MRNVLWGTAFATIVGMASVGFAQGDLQLQMQRMLAGSAPFALELSGRHTTMPPTSERNLFLFTALRALGGMSVDCSPMREAFPAYDDVFCAGLVGRAPQLLGDWQEPRETSAFVLIPWEQDEQSLLSAVYVVDHGLLLMFLASVPNAEASAVVGFWAECTGRLGGMANVSAWSEPEKASLSSCLERLG